MLCQMGQMGPIYALSTRTTASRVKMCPLQRPYVCCIARCRYIVDLCVAASKDGTKYRSGTDICICVCVGGTTGTVEAQFNRT